MDQTHRDDDRRLREAAAPIVQHFPGNIWLVHLIARRPDGRVDKPPAPGFRTNDPATWYSLAQAIEQAGQYPPGAAGIGFSIPDGMISFDFDDCIDADGATAAEIAAVIERLDSFGYVTVSGRGRRVICRNAGGTTVAPGKYARRTASGRRVEIFVGPAPFYNTLGAETDGKPIRPRAGEVHALLAELDGSGGGTGGSGAAGGNIGEIGRTSDLGRRARDQAALFDALRAIPNDDAVDRQLWTTIGAAVYGATDGSEEGREAFTAWSESWVDYDEALHAEHTEALWESFDNAPPRTIGAGTVFRMAKEHGWRWPEEPPTPDTGGDADDTEDEAEAPPPSLSEAALALHFARRHRGDLRFVAKRKQWRRWSGAVWEEDETQRALNEARKLCQHVAASCERAAQARGIVKFSTANATLRYAGATPELAATLGQWDADPWLLNTPGGMLDPRTGETRPHRPEDYATKITAVTPDPGCPCPRWLKFLDEIMAGDQALVDYLQRVAGGSRNQKFGGAGGPGAHQDRKGRTSAVGAAAICGTNRAARSNAPPLADR